MSAFTIASWIEAMSPLGDLAETPLFVAPELCVDDDGWLQILAQLREWASKPAEYWDDELAPPSAESLRAAEQLTGALRDLDALPVFSVLMSGDGGIVFEARKGTAVFLIEIAETGAAEVKIFDDSRLVNRGPLTFGAG